MMLLNEVYLLWFTFRADEHEALLIGVYESEALAEQAKARLMSKPGFVGEADGFEIATYQVNKDHWTEGFVRTE